MFEGCERNRVFCLYVNVNGAEKKRIKKNPFSYSKKQKETVIDVFPSPSHYVVVKGGFRGRL